MSMQDKLGKFGSFIGKALDTTKAKAEEIHLKDRIVSGAQLVGRKAKQGYQAVRADEVYVIDVDGKRVVEIKKS